MLVKDGVAYLQAGGGIVFDSDPYDEWMETINKLGGYFSFSHVSGRLFAGEQSAEEKLQAQICSA